MLEERRSRLLSLAAIVPVMLAAVFSTHVTTMLCRVSGLMVQAKACCPEESPDGVQGDSPKPVVDGPARLRNEDCCAVTNLELPRVLSENASPDPRLSWQPAGRRVRASSSTWGGGAGAWATRWIDASVPYPPVPIALLQLSSAAPCPDHPLTFKRSLLL